MFKPLGLTSLLLISSALVAPAAARAQSTSGEPSTGAATPQATPQTDAAPQAPQTEDQTDVSIPGANDIIVVGQHNADISREAPQVVSVLSSADIARTGEGDVAGALGRVSGLSVVGNGFVYVRGLGDRYSLALLNGSPLPSPEPLKRVVPLDLFPTSLISSSLVQKSYSVNFPGEFGGGVINLTTKTAPKDAFLSIGGTIAGESETTGQLGYTYYGSKTDWLGYDNGQRNLPPALQDFVNSGHQISDDGVDQQAIARQLVTGRNSVVQRNKKLPPNWSATITGGKSFDVGDDLSLGVIATGGYSNTWRTRDTLQQTANALDLSSTNLDFERVITDDHVVVNGLLGLSLEFGQNTIRLTNLYIHDTIKEARLGIGSRNADSPGATFQEQNTAFFERQLIDSQLVGEFKLSPDIELDVRGGYANSKRKSPFEFTYIYSRSNSPTDPYGQFFTNTLNVGQRPGSASVAFSTLNEDLYSGGIDMSYKVLPTVTATVGFAYSDTNRRTDRRDFLFQGNNDIPLAVSLFRPDLLLEPTVIDYYKVGLVDSTGSNPAYRAKLSNNGTYAQLEAQITPDLSLNAGVRYENANESVSPIQVYTVSPILPPATKIDRDYLLPAATLTYQVTPKLQFRLNGSKTIARPQFRELVFQTYYDPDTNTTYQGNPQLVDSQLYNGEARFEWYFARAQRISVAGFYKRIDHPIETYASFDGNNVITRFANAPKANLYGGEVDAQKYFDLSDLSDGRFFAARRAVLIANYTYTKSRIKVGPDDPVLAFPLSVTLANQLFRDGTPLTGQSDHIVNLEFGLEDQASLSQQTFLVSYASKRVTRRGPSGQPDIYEAPGIHLDFVARQGIKIGGVQTELKLDIRNITGTKYKEYQESGPNRVYYNRYDVGTSGSLGLSVNF